MNVVYKKNVFALIMCLPWFLNMLFISVGFACSSDSDLYTSESSLSITTDDQYAWGIFAQVVNWQSGKNKSIILDLDYYDTDKHLLSFVFEHIVNGGSIPKNIPCSEERFVFLTCYLLAGHYYVVHQEYEKAKPVLDYLHQHPQYIKWAYDNLKYEWFDAQYLYGYVCATQSEYDTAISSWQEIILHLDQFPVIRPTNPDTFNYVFSDLQELVSWQNNIKGSFVLYSEENAIYDFLVLDDTGKFGSWNSVDTKFARSSILLASGLYDAAFSLLKTIEAEIDDIESFSTRARLLTQLAQATWYSKNDFTQTIKYLEAANAVCPRESFDIQLDIHFWMYQVYSEFGDTQHAQKIIGDILGCWQYSVLSDPVSQYYMQHIRDSQ